MTSHSNFVADDNDRAAVVGTVATVGGGVGDGAVATVTVTNPDDEIIVTEGNHLKSSFPRTRESRTNNSAQPTKLNKVRCARLSSLDTGSSPVWSVVDGGGGGVGGGAVIAGNGKVPSASPTDMFSLDSRVRGNDEP